MDDALDLVGVGVRAENLVKGALEFDAHAHGTLDFPASVAIRAGVVDRAADGLGGALAGHFHEAERADWQGGGFGPVAWQPGFYAGMKPPLVRPGLAIHE